MARNCYTSTYKRLCAQVLLELEQLCSALPGRADGGAWAERAECMVCMTAPRGTRLLPCCHAILCAPCATELMRRSNGCPACRAVVERYEEGVFDTTFAPANAFHANSNAFHAPASAFHAPANAFHASSNAFHAPAASVIPPPPPSVQSGPGLAAVPRVHHSDSGQVSIQCGSQCILA